MKRVVVLFSILVTLVVSQWFYRLSAYSHNQVGTIQEQCDSDHFFRGSSSEGDEMKKSNIALLKEMFDEMVVKKDASLIPKYYAKDFLLYTNGQTHDYAYFLSMHEEIYQTAIRYSFRYDEETLFEKGDHVAGRVFITTSRPNEEPKEIEVVLIGEVKDGKFTRVWELTYPDWSKLPAFE